MLYSLNIEANIPKHKRWVSCANFADNCAQTQAFPNTPFIIRGIIFFVHGTNVFTSVFMHFVHILKKIVIIFLRIRHATSHFLMKQMSKYYFWRY